MSNGEMQACLARLYVDDCFRQLFGIDSRAATREYDLAEEEIVAIESIDRRMLNFFARSLKHKRRKRLERDYPLISSLDRETLGRFWSLFFQLHILKVQYAQYHDGQDFGFFMEEALAGVQRLPPYASDLAKYERLYLAAKLTPFEQDYGADSLVGDDARPVQRGGVRFATFDYDVITVEITIQDGAPITDYASLARKTSIVFAPSPAAHQPRMLRLNEPARVVFELCNGRRTLREIVEEARRVLGADGLETGILDTVQRLLSVHVLRLTPSSTIAAREFRVTESEGM